MGFKKNSPGCPCCGEICLLQSNDLTSLADLTGNFTLVDAANFAYDATLGGIEISTASQTATASTAHPQSPYPPRAQIEFQFDTIGGEVLLILGGQITIKVTAGDDCAQLDILDDTAAEITPTLYMPGIAIDEWHRLTACYDPDTGVVRATVLDIAADESYDSSGTKASVTLGRYAAFGTGSGHTGNAYVRNFRYWRLWYCGDSPHTEDCGSLDDYYDPQERTYCYTCATACTVASDDFTEMEDGPMPCTWDADGTDWQVSGGAAIGTGSVCHTFVADGGGYAVEATFSIGTLATVGDSVSVSLSNGTLVAGATITKEATRYRIDWTPSSIVTVYSTVALTSVSIAITGETACITVSGILGKETLTGTPGDICVSITQPTLTGHADASLLGFSIAKTRELDPACPPSNDCTIPCVPCIDGVWPGSLRVDISGLEESEVVLTPTCASLNTGYYLTTTSLAPSISGCCSRVYFDDIGSLSCSNCIRTLLVTCCLVESTYATRVSGYHFYPAPYDYWMYSGAPTIVVGHYYLKVELALRICCLSSNPTTSMDYRQLWLKDVGTASPDKINCEQFSSEQLTWSGHWRYPSDSPIYSIWRYCGGSYTNSGGPVISVPSASVAKVTSL